MTAGSELPAFVALAFWIARMELMLRIRKESLEFRDFRSCVSARGKDRVVRGIPLTKDRFQFEGLPISCDGNGHTVSNLTTLNQAN